MGKQLTGTFVRYLKNLLYRKFLVLALKTLSFFLEILIVDNSCSSRFFIFCVFWHNR